MNSMLSRRIRHSIIVAFAFLLFGLFISTESSRAHIVPEEPWHPAPATYLRSLFYANQRPIDWPLIAEGYETITELGYGRQFDSVYDTLAPANALSDFDHESAIRTAIAAQDREALYVATTRANSQLTRAYLQEASTKLDQPGGGTESILLAQQLYRAFGQRFLSQTDPDAAKSLGLAWLELSSSVGHAGVSGVGRIAADVAKFEAARGTIEAYLIENYEADSYALPAKLAPIPATVMETAPLLAPWLPPGSNINDQDPLPLLSLNFEERGIEEADIPLVAYGDMLFDSPTIFGEPAQSLGIACSTCHNRSDINNTFFIPGVSHQPGAADVDGGFFNPLFNDMRSDSLDIPSLRGIRFTGPYGRDGRFGSLRDFTRNVIVNEFGGAEPTPLMLDTLVAYMQEFDWQPNSLLNRDGTLNEKAPADALRGERLFNTSFESMGNQSCASCHVTSANFLDRLAHDIGSGNPASEFSLDSAFDTPTLLNTLYTAPYFHDGSLATLAAVVDWFDEQFTLELSQADRADLTAYLIAVGSADNPWEIFDEEETIFALNWAELSTFLTTLDTLIPLHDNEHIILLLDTVTPDLRLDASGATDRYIIPNVYKIADKLDELRVAVLADDWALAAQLNEDYKALAAEYGPAFK